MIVYCVLLSVSHILLTLTFVSCNNLQFVIQFHVKYHIFFCFDVSITCLGLLVTSSSLGVWVSTRIRLWLIYLNGLLLLSFSSQPHANRHHYNCGLYFMFVLNVTAEPVPYILRTSWTKKSSLWRVQINRIWLHWHGLPIFSLHCGTSLCVPYLNLAHLSFSSSSYAQRKVPLEILSDCGVSINGEAQSAGSLLPSDLVREPWWVVSQSLLIADHWWPVACRWYII